MPKHDKAGYYTTEELRQARQASKQLAKENKVLARFCFLRNTREMQVKQIVPKLLAEFGIRRATLFNYRKRAERRARA